jgi:hypothetical protein
MFNLIAVAALLLPAVDSTRMQACIASETKSFTISAMHCIVNHKQIDYIKF